MERAIRNYRFDSNDTDYDEATNSVVETFQEFVSTKSQGTVVDT